MSDSLVSRELCLEEVSSENYDTLREICEKYKLNTYVWCSINTVSIFPDKGSGSIDLLGSSEVLKLNKHDLVDPDWGEIENSIFTHSLSVTFL